MYVFALYVFCHKQIQQQQWRQQQNAALDLSVMIPFFFVSALCVCVFFQISLSLLFVGHIQADSCFRSGSPFVYDMFVNDVDCV